MGKTNPLDSAVHQKKREWRTAPFFFRLKIGLVLFLISFLVAGCVTLDDPEVSQEQYRTVIARIQPGGYFEQTMQPRRPGLSQVTLYLAGSTADGNSLWLNINLYDANEQLTSQRLSLPPSTASVPFNIKIPTQEQSAGKTYRLRISIEAGELSIYGEPADQSPYGESLLQGDRLAADAGFRTAYFYNLTTLVNDLIGAAPQLWLLLPLFTVLFLPGWIILTFLNLRRRFQLPEIIALSFGLSLAFFPVLMAWTSVTGLAWNRAMLITLLLLLALAAIFSIRKARINASSSENVDLKGPPASWTAIFLLVIVAGSLLVRFLMVRNIEAPPWVDSIHHGLITRLILENGAFPQSYIPYLDIAPTAYHPGFHAVLAAFLWLSRLDMLKGMLILGQVLNALAVLVVYLLGVAMTKERLVGLSAALVAGFFTPMPAYYTSWGRYPHLAGLTILATAFALYFFWVETITKSPSPKRLQASFAAGAGLACAGLFITHYRVAIFLAALLTAHWVCWILSQSHLQLRPFKLDMSNTHRMARPTLLAMFATSLVGIILALPWFLPAVAQLLLPKLQAWRGSPIRPFSDFTWSYLTAAQGMLAMRIAAPGIIVGLIRRQAASLSLLLWISLMLFLANLDALSLPGAGLINDASVTITLFMPTALAAGLLIGGVNAGLMAFLPTRVRPAYAMLLVASAVTVSAYAAKSLIPLLNQVTILYHREDAEAIRWVAQHTLPEETILINPFAWGYGTYAGQDGAYWLSALAGRRTIPPPVLYGLGNSSTEVEMLNQEIQQYIDQAQNPLVLSELMREQGMRYLVIGRRGGIFSPTLLVESGAFQEIYQRNGVWILQATSQ